MHGIPRLLTRLGSSPSSYSWLVATSGDENGSEANDTTALSTAAGAQTNPSSIAHLAQPVSLEFGTSTQHHRVPEMVAGRSPSADRPEAKLATRLLVVAPGHLDLNLPRLGVLGLGHRQHQQAIAVHGVNLRCVNRRPQAQRAA
jgi:hypothetical protein